MTVRAASETASAARRTGFTFAADGSYAACLAQAGGHGDEGGPWFPERWTLGGPEPYTVPLPGREPEEPGAELLPLSDGRVLISRRTQGGRQLALLYPAGPDTAELQLGTLPLDEVTLVPMPAAGPRFTSAAWHSGPILALAVGTARTPRKEPTPQETRTRREPEGAGDADAADEPDGPGGPGGPSEAQERDQPRQGKAASGSPVGGSPADVADAVFGHVEAASRYEGEEAAEYTTSVWRVTSHSSEPGRTPRPRLVAEFPGRHVGGTWLDRAGRLLALDRLSDDCTKTVVLNLENRTPNPSPLLQLAPDSNDRLLLADPDSGLLVVRSDAPGGDRVGWGVLGSRRPFRFPECLRLPYAVVTPFAVQPGAALTPEDCGVALRVDGPRGARLAVWWPAYGTLNALPAPEGWLAGAGHWSPDGLRLPYATGECPFGVATVSPADPATRGVRAARSSAPAPARVPIPVPAPAPAPPPTPAEPISAEPVTAEPAALAPATLEPAPPEPPAIEPAPTEPATVKPVVVDIPAIEPTTAERPLPRPVATEPASTEAVTTEAEATRRTAGVTRHRGALRAVEPLVSFDDASDDDSLGDRSLISGALDDSADDDSAADEAGPAAPPDGSSQRLHPSEAEPRTAPLAPKPPEPAGPPPVETAPDSAGPPPLRRPVPLQQAPLAAVGS